jgi:hypothetical protein
LEGVEDVFDLVEVRRVFGVSGGVGLDKIKKESPTKGSYWESCLGRDKAG